MSAENTTTTAGGVTMSLFPYSRAAFDYTSGLIRAWHDVPAIVAGETIILGQLLDVAHTEALTEHTNRMMSAAFDADANLHPGIGHFYSGSWTCYCGHTATPAERVEDRAAHLRRPTES